MVTSPVVDQELIVRVGKFDQLLDRFSKGSRESKEGNDDRPEWEFRRLSSVHKEPNEILIGRRQTLR